MNTKMNMKIAAMTACAMIAVGATIKPVYAEGRKDAGGTKEEQLNYWKAMVKETHEEKFIVKYVSKNGDFTEKVKLECTKGGYPTGGVNEHWRNADEAGRKQLMEQTTKIVNEFEKKYDLISAIRSGWITKSWFYTFVPKGTIKIGDQVTAKIIPATEHPFYACPSWNGMAYYVAGIDQVIKHSESKSDSNSNSGSGNAFKSSFLN